jgi:hypothetical protein
MTDLEQARQQLLADLGYKPLHRNWAKLEIALGLLAVAVSLFLLVSPTSGGRWLGELSQPGGIILFVLGGYLTLAGHRSHHYQSLNDLAAYLLWQTRRQPERNKVP